MLFDFTKQELPKSNLATESSFATESDFTLAKVDMPIDIINKWYSTASATNIYWSTDTSTTDVMCIKFNKDGSFGPIESKSIPDTGNTITTNNSNTFFYSVDFLPSKTDSNAFKVESKLHKSLDALDDIMAMSDDEFYEWDTQHAEPYDYDENDPMWF